MPPIDKRRAGPRSGAVAPMHWHASRVRYAIHDASNMPAQQHLDFKIKKFVQIQFKINV
jgi:hypothetical protein